MIRTGGSDYHGKNKPNHHMGYGHGNLGETMDRIQVNLLKSPSFEDKMMEIKLK